jgi:hypothetical protein
MAIETKTEAKIEKGGVVVKAKKAGHVGLWETDAEHKKFGHAEGEIFVKDEPLRVALTSGVAAAIKAGNLVETDERPAEKKVEK